MTHIIKSLCLRDNECIDGCPSLTTMAGERAQATVVPVLPDAGRKETASPWIEKYEMGTGKDRINVRIFKEPAT